MTDATETARLADKVAALEAKLTRRRAKDCDHAALVVAQDPDDGRKERLTCPDCDMEPRRRVSAAASMKDRVEEQLAECRFQQELLAKALEVVNETNKALNEGVAALHERVAKLEAFGGAG